MKRVCGNCGAAPITDAAHGPVSGGVCADCAARLSVAAGVAPARALAERIDAPVLVLRGDPRVVFTANARALRLFGKAAVEGRRGGEVFDCVNAFTELGCGKDPGCDECRIKHAVVAALESGAHAAGVNNPLKIRTGSGDRTFAMEVSAERAGELVLLRIDRFQPTDS